jgi:dihydrodipicolinate reductase
VVGLRAGDAIGDRTVILGGVGKRIELIHRAEPELPRQRCASRRDVGATDRLGVYAMRDVLGL